MAYLERLAPPPGHLPWTLPRQPEPPQPAAGRRAGKVVALAGFALVAVVVGFRLVERRPSKGEPKRAPQHVAAARPLAGAAAILAFS
ncbi:MAG TPA: hypothetical protein VME41_05145, partial [Stellaceae bacterium]|nr:hypothetical protein [Stellaceae bacterium]